MEAVSVPILKHRAASGRLADQRGYGYETLKLTKYPSQRFNEIISEPLMLAIHELPGLCELFTSCFGAEHEGNPSSLCSTKEIILMHFKIHRREYLQGSVFSFSCCFTKHKTFF